MSNKSLGFWLRNVVRLPSEAVDVLIPKLIAKQVCELKHLNILREAGGLGTLFVERPAAEMQAVSTALDQFYPPTSPAGAGGSPPQPTQPSQPLQPAVVAPNKWGPPPADAPAVLPARVDAGGKQAPLPPQQPPSDVPGSMRTGNPLGSGPGPTMAKTPNLRPHTMGYARDFGMEHPYAMAAAAAAAASAAATAAAVQAALPPGTAAPGVQPASVSASMAPGGGVQPTGGAVRAPGLPPPAPAGGHTPAPPAPPAPPGPPGPPRGVADHTAMAQAGAVAAAASAAASAAMAPSPTLHPAPAAPTAPAATVTSARKAQGRGCRPTGGAPGALAGAVGHGTTGRAPPPIEAAVETVSG
jgi:hypothetical protein